MDQAFAFDGNLEKSLPATGRLDLPPADLNRQTFVRRGIHGWYNFVLGFSDQLVAQMLDLLKVECGQQVLDPFCGTGTTLVECRKWGINSIGIDASPFSCFVSRVKTNPHLTPQSLETSIEPVEERYHASIRKGRKFTNDPSYRYFSDSGMIERGWISRKPLRKALILKHAIHRSAINPSCRDAMLLALAGELPTKIANMRFGPEIYCSAKKRDIDLMPGFRMRVSAMVQDLKDSENVDLGIAKVHLGDARKCQQLLKRRGPYKVDAVITSPPYPTEHDYTRNTRLELAMLDFIKTPGCVRAIKQNMIRSHTKGVYLTDKDCRLVSDNESIKNLVRRIKRESDKKTYGFARLYPKVVQLYFGGMKRHLNNLAGMLEPGSLCAFVLGDQASYLGIKVPTADILADLAEDSGFVADDLIVWRKRWATATSRQIKEHILILRKASK